MFLESEEEFAMGQILAAGSLSPLPEPCGVGGETGPFPGHTSSPRIGGKHTVQLPGPGP